MGRQPALPDSQNMTIWLYCSKLLASDTFLSVAAEVECGLLRMTARNHLIVNDVAYGCGAFLGIKPLENPRVGSSILPLATTIQHPIPRFHFSAGKPREDCGHYACAY